MSIFNDALGAAREAVRDVFAVAMTVTAMRGGEFKRAQPDPTRPPFAIRGILHEHVTPSRAEESVIERTDGARPGPKFGVDVAVAPTRISFDVADLGGWVPPDGTMISIDGAGRSFQVSFAGPQNAGRVYLYVTEVA